MTKNIIIIVLLLVTFIMYLDLRNIIINHPTIGTLSAFSFNGKAMKDDEFIITMRRK